MDDRSQLNVLSRIWGRDRDGYVFLPWISGKAKDANERRKSYNEGPAFKWPEDTPRILEHLERHHEDDLYFTPCLFTFDRRIEQQAEPERALWADLDAVDPESIPDAYRPTIAWQTSPGRYQAVWLLNKPLVGASWAGKENQQLTYLVGADRGGWDTTQLLRVPGRGNFKPDYRTDGKVPYGRMVWRDGPIYTAEDFCDLPVVNGHTADTELLDEELLAGIDRHEVWARVRLKVSNRVREFMAIKRSADVDDIAEDQPEGRSGVLWQIERDLADAGCSLAEIVAVVRPSPWNKFAGRQDELKCLKNEAAKAIEQASDTESLEDAATAKPSEILWIYDVAARGVKRPSWLIRDIWTVSGCGFIAGAPKSYKSFFALDMAVALSTGGTFLDQWPVMGRERPVLYIQEEDGAPRVIDRLGRIIESKAPSLHWHGQMRREPRGVVWYPPATDQLPLAVHVRSGFVASDPAWQSWLDEIMAKGAFEAVIIDTFSTTAGDVDTDKAIETVPLILKPLKQLSDKHNAAVVIVHHNRKDQVSAAGRAGAKMLGSIQLHAWVEDALYVGSRERTPGGYNLKVERESKNTDDLLFNVRVPKMHDGDDAGADAVMWAPEVSVGAPETPTNGGGGDTRRGARTAGGRVATQVKAMGGGGKTWVPTNRIIEVMGVPRASVLKQLTSAVDNGLLEGSPDEGYRSVER